MYQSLNWQSEEYLLENISFSLFFFDQLFLFFSIYFLLFFWTALVFYFYFFDSKNFVFLKKISLWISFLIWIITCFSIFNQIFLTKNIVFFWYEFSWLSFYGISYIIYIDFVSSFFIFLSALIIPFCILCLWDQINIKLDFFIFLLIFLLFLLIGVFSVADLLLFYLYFETSLIPMYLLLGLWGSRYRKIHAANLLFLYTFAGSIFFLISTLLLLNLLQNISWFFLLKFSNFLPGHFQNFFWICFFISFAVKIPLFPFHIWLPEAHVEAPTVGSVILAAILLKLGTYGVLRFLLPFYIYANVFFQPFVFTLAILGVIYASLATLRQIDIKKIIAYSSVSHMNLVVLGLFSFNTIACSGASLMMISHGIISSALFLSIGVLYDRYHTKIIKYYGGLIYYMPIFGFLFLFFSFSNISFPLTFGFVGELLIFLGIFKISASLAFLATISIILGAIYSIWLYNRIFYGESSNNIFYFSDVNRREFIILFYFSILIIFFGIFPNYFLEYFEVNINYYNLYLW